MKIMIGGDQAGFPLKGPVTEFSEAAERRIGHRRQQEGTNQNR